MLKYDKFEAVKPIIDALRLAIVDYNVELKEIQKEYAMSGVVSIDLDRNMTYVNMLETSLKLIVRGHDRLAEDIEEYDRLSRLP